MEAHWSFVDLCATNIYVTLQNSRCFTEGILSSEGVSKLRFLFKSSNEHTAFHWYLKGGFSPFYPHELRPWFKNVINILRKCIFAIQLKKVFQSISQKYVKKVPSISGTIHPEPTDCVSLFHSTDLTTSRNL